MFGVNDDTWISRWVGQGVPLAAGAACLVAARTSRIRFACLAIGGALLANALGNLLYSLEPDPELVPVPFIADPLWFAIYPCMYAAVLVLVRRDVGPTLLATRLDGALSGVAVASVLACWSVPLALDSAAHSSFAAAATALAYPLGDLILLGAVVSALALRGWRIDARWGALAAATLAWEVADQMYLVGVVAKTALLADALVLTGIVGFAASVCVGRSARTVTASSRGLLLPIGFGVVALAILTAGAPLNINFAALGLASVALALLLVRTVLALRENHVLLDDSRVEATTDSLTGLGNQRLLKRDLSALFDADEPPSAHVLVLLDLNGFKTYNDTYGHGAGDALLTRLGTALAAAVGDRGKTYRMGGDEFTVLAPCRFGDADGFADRCGAALVAEGSGFRITASYGAAELPAECGDGVSALKLADERMYRHKNSGRVAAAAQSAGVLMAVLEERAPDLAAHGRAVREISLRIAAELSLDEAERESLSHAAALHEIGTLAMPREIGDDDELLRHQPEVAERILSAAIALAPSARIVRSARERVDGGGFPDALSGDDIPLGARIIAVATAFEAARDATASDAGGLAEIRKYAGTAFDARIVAAVEHATRAVAVG
ncbi:MAG: hypothetical protein QOI80_495 [Solirubrobacteraceae bacterium]|nr:hypothetical protein [Solirubrobacteraceae bacterium]